MRPGKKESLAPRDSRFDEKALGRLKGALTVAEKTGISYFEEMARPVIFALRHGGFLLLAAIGVASAPLAAHAADVIGVRFGVTSPTETRIVIDLSGPTRYSLETRTNALTVEFPDAGIGVKSGAGEGQVANYAVTKAKSGGKLVFTLAAPGLAANEFEIAAKAKGERHRLVIDLKAGALELPPAPVAAAAAPPPYEDLTAILEAVAPTPASTEMTPAPPEAKRELPVIVIDPGHGGGDPGASSPGGISEKTVTLASARRLAEILQESGRYKTVLTRADDSRLALEQRAKIAREAGADLFISLHADAMADASVRGGSVYTLSKDGTARSAQEAEASGNFNNVYGVDLEDWSAGDPALNRILYDQAAKKTLSNSGRYANLLLKRLKGVTPLINNSHREADLKVLLSPDVPAVLFELAFISNDKDAANLASPVWRTRTMTAVAASIEDYFQAQTEVTAAAAAPSGR